MWINVFIFLGYVFENEITTSHDNCLTFSEKNQTVWQNACPLPHPHQQWTKVTGIHSFVHTCYCPSFLLISILVDKELYCIVDLTALASWLMMLIIFYVPVGYLYMSFRKICIQIICHIFNWFDFSLLSWSYLYIWILVPYWMYHL